MMPSIRCFSCGKPVGDKQEEFEARTKPPAEGGKGEPAEQVLDDLGLDRYCCRRMVLGYSNLIDEILPYPRF
jgi:DNA-directed RNA polymerase subunit N